MILQFADLLSKSCVREANRNQIFVVPTGEKFNVAFYKAMLLSPNGNKKSSPMPQPGGF